MTTEEIARFWRWGTSQREKDRQILNQYLRRWERVLGLPETW